MFLICVYGLNARGIQNPNIMVGMLVFFGGICQVFAGLMEFVTGNTVCLYYVHSPNHYGNNWADNNPIYSSDQPSSAPMELSTSPTA